jgi:predicted dehydrogenase
MTEFRVGIIGTGFMGQAHAFALRAVGHTFDLPCTFVLDTVADVTEKAAEDFRRRFVVERATTNWRTLCTDPKIDIVSITAPNALHKEMALAAIAHGKHVWCEKPLAPLASEALEMTEAAEAAGVKTQVGFNYLCNPIFRLAREMIRAGELGEIRAYRGLHAEDYMADRNAPFTFRHDPAGGGAFADLGSHALATAEYLCGPIARLMGDTATVIGERPTPTGPRKVETNDVGRAFLRFANGATGAVEASWIAHGRKMQHDFEVVGEKASLAFHGQHLNELLHAPAGQPFRTIEAGPATPPYGQFCVAPGHQLGFNDLKTIEAWGYARALLGEASEPFNFRAGHRIQSLVELVHRSSTEERWLDAPAA